MSKLNNPDELEDYINDLITNRQQHQNDEPLELVGALIYAIQTREFFNIDFEYYLRNVSYEEKNQIKDTLKYRSENSTKPLTPQQNRLFNKLVESLPKDSVAKKNEERRAKENLQNNESDKKFLNSATEELSSLKRKLGDELKKKVVNVDSRVELQRQIVELQERVQQLMQSTNPSIQKRARNISPNILDSDEQTQVKLRFIEESIDNLRNIDVLTGAELTNIQQKLNNNKYAYSHIPEIREKTAQALKIISDIRSQQLTEDKMQNLTVLQALKVHKQWGDGAKFQDPKFPNFTAEHIKDFYVMHPNQQSEEKNDIKMHISIDPEQANDAMQIIHDLVKSEKYAELIHEYKVGDIEYINERIQDNSRNLNEKLTNQLQGSNINIQELVNELKKEYPNVEPIIQKIKSQFPTEQQAKVESTLNQVCSNELGAIISAERILHDALFTVYFKNDFPKEKLQDFCKELNQKLQAQNIRNGNIAKTDVGVNAFCGITIDHVIDPISGQKKYLEGSKPEDVAARQKALRDNPLTHDLMPKISNEEALSLMAFHQDEKDYNGLSAFITKGMTLQIPLDQQIALAGKLVAEKFKKIKDVNLVYRNPDMLTKWVVKDVFSKLNFPVPPDKKQEFFELVEKANGQPPNEEAKTELKKYFSDPNPKPEIVQMLQPFYQDYLQHVKDEFAKDNKDTKMGQLEYRDLLEQRVQVAKKQFLGHVSFPFVESLAFELQEKDGFTPSRNANLALGFLALRKQGIMDNFLKALDNPVQIPKLRNETIEQAFSNYQKGNRDYIEVKQQHERMMEPVRERTTALYKQVNKIASSLPKDNELKPILEQIAGSIETVKTELDHKLLRGEKITQQDVENVDEQFDKLMTKVKGTLNNTSLRSETLLHDAVRKGNKDLVDVLLNVGCNPKLTTTNYKRGFLGALKDAFNGKPGDFFKNLLNPIPRTASQLASFLGQDEILKSLRNKEHELSNPTVPEAMTHKLESLEHLVEQKDDVNIPLEKSPSMVNVFQLQSDKHSEKTNNDFPVGWLRRIDEQIKAIDKGYNNEQNSVIIQALKDVKNFLEGRVKLEFKKDSPELKVLESVIERAKNASRYGFPPEVIQMFNQMKEGTIPPNVNPVLDKVMGPKTEFAEKWDEHLTKMMEKGDVPKFMVEEIKNGLSLNPGVTPDNLGTLKSILERIEKAAAGNMKPELKQVIDGIRKGEMPEDASKAQIRRN